VGCEVCAHYYFKGVLVCCCVLGLGEVGEGTGTYRRDEGCRIGYFWTLGDGRVRGQ
jgi:hypothetical protein